MGARSLTSRLAGRAVARPGRRILAVVAILAASVTTAVTSSNVAAADAGPVFTAMNTSETPPDGMWFRNSPHTADTDRVTGHGVYRGEQVQLQCYAWGDSVGQYHNTLWYYVKNVTRPTNAGVANQGYLNAHYINDGKVANQVDAGVPECGASTQPVQLPSGGSLYYSPYPSKAQGWISYHHGINGLIRKVYAPSPATLTLGDEQWHKGTDCTAGYAVPNLDGTAGGRLITTLAGWSYGRNGPMMFLAAKSPWWRQVHYILLFDPGNVDDYFNGVCDKQYPGMSSLLANWLAQDAANRIVVLAGQVTADYAHPIHGYAHAGIQNVLFPALRSYPAIHGRNIRQQAIVCNYDNMNHEDVWINFKNYMNLTPITLSTCPTTRSYPHVVSWNP